MSSLIGYNSGLLGVRRTPTPGSASGIWVPNEQSLAKRAAIWPTTGDEHFGNVSLLLHMDGSNGSTTFTDSSSNALTVTGYPGYSLISTAQSKFGGASGSFDGNYASLNFSGISIDPSEDVTIEAWIYPTVTDSRAIVGNGGNANVQTLVIQNNQLLAYWNGTQVSGGSVTTNTWQHVAVTRQSGTIRLFLNGNLVGTSAGNTQPLNISVIGYAIYSSRFVGYIDEVRITKGVCRYTANFTPPTAAFPS